MDEELIKMTKTLEIGSTEYIRVHVQKLNRRAEEAVSSHTAPEIQEIERNYTRPDDSLVKRFTEQQIDDYCEKVENLCLVCRNEGALMFQSVRIIRQLQEGLRQAFIERRVYVDMSWERPEEHIIAIDQLQCVAQVLLEKETARDQQEHLQGA